MLYEKYIVTEFMLGMYISANRRYVKLRFFMLSVQVYPVTMWASGEVLGMKTT